MQQRISGAEGTFRRFFTLFRMTGTDKAPAGVTDSMNFKDFINF